MFLSVTNPLKPSLESDLFSPVTCWKSRWDQLIVLQDTIKFHIFAVESKIRTGKSRPSQVLNKTSALRNSTVWKDLCDPLIIDSWVNRVHFNASWSPFWCFAIHFRVYNVHLNAPWSPRASVCFSTGSREDRSSAPINNTKIHRYHFLWHNCFGRNIYIPFPFSGANYYIKGLRGDWVLSPMVYMENGEGRRC